MSREISEEEYKLFNLLKDVHERMMDEAIKREAVVLTDAVGGYRYISIDNTNIIVTEPKSLHINPGDRVITINGKIVEMMPEGLEVPKSKPIVNDFERIQWNQIGGMNSQIEIIRRKVEYPITHSKVYKEFNLPTSKGVVLYGPPGCGL